MEGGAAGGTGQMMGSHSALGLWSLPCPLPYLHLLTLTDVVVIMTCFLVRTLFLSLAEGSWNDLSQEGSPIVCKAATGSPLGAVSTGAVFKIKTIIESIWDVFLACAPSSNPWEKTWLSQVFRYSLKELVPLVSPLRGRQLRSLRRLILGCRVLYTGRIIKIIIIKQNNNSWLLSRMSHVPGTS